MPLGPYEHVILVMPLGQIKHDAGSLIVWSESLNHKSR
jgi:hypothetical protein